MKYPKRELIAQFLALLVSFVILALIVWVVWNLNQPLIITQTVTGTTTTRTVYP